jgi:hypothetical protein
MEAKREWIRNYFKEVLVETRGNAAQAAKIAGMNRTDFYNRIRSYGLTPLLKQLHGSDRNRKQSVPPIGGDAGAAWLRRRVEVRA